MYCLLTFLLLCMGSTTLLAQAPRGGKPPEPGPTPVSPTEAKADTYAESTSRDLFTACDANSDDRLDLFEACDAFDSLHGPTDLEGFARFDKDRDGFVGWSEFDQHFKATVQHGTTFRVRSCRRFVQQAPEHEEARATTPLQQFMQMFDANRNGGLDPAEIDKLLLPLTLFAPALGGELKKLDLDHSGRIDASELAPWFEHLRGMVPSLAGGGLGAGSQLIPPWAAGDQDRNGTIDDKELGLMLQHLDPSLLRWASALLQALDKNKDGRLGAEELTGGNPTPARPKSAAPAAPLPKQAPLR